MTVADDDQLLKDALDTCESCIALGQAALSASDKSTAAAEALTDIMGADNADLRADLVELLAGRPARRGAAAAAAMAQQIQDAREAAAAAAAASDSAYTRYQEIDKTRRTKCARVDRKISDYEQENEQWWVRLP